VLRAELWDEAGRAFREYSKIIVMAVAKLMRVGE
jgi:hypothetical protein